MPCTFVINFMNKYIAIGIALVVVGSAFWFLGPGLPPENLVNEMPITSGENPEPGGIHDLPAEPAAVEARKDLAAKLNASEKSIVIMLVEERTWSDGCLGLGGIAESCLQALVEGFRVELLAQGKTYVYRTDKTGVSLRMETH